MIARSAASQVVYDRVARPTRHRTVRAINTSMRQIWRWLALTAVGVAGTAVQVELGITSLNSGINALEGREVSGAWFFILYGVGCNKSHKRGDENGSDELHGGLVCDCD
jgi:hypothetical protein